MVKNDGLVWFVHISLSLVDNYTGVYMNREEVISC